MKVSMTDTKRQKKLQDMYQDYITNYSLDSAALGWESIKFIDTLLTEVLHPALVLDTGSGFLLLY